MATSITNTSVTTNNLIGDNLTTDTITADTNTIKVDATNNRVGIGTATPTKVLDITQSTSDDNANVKLTYAGGDGNRAGFILKNTHTGGREYGIYAGNNATGGGLGNSLGISDNTASTAYRLIIDSAGRVTMPNQPAWWAQTYNTFSFNATGTLEFNSTNVGMAEKLDVGNNYNPTTGRFTAPVAGTYFVMLTCSASYGSNYLYLYIMKNGSDIISRNYAQNSQYLEQTLQVVTTLAVGDYVSCKTEKNYVGGALYGPSFCGFLIG